MKGIFCQMGTILFLILNLNTAGFAQEGEVEAVKKQIQQLTERINQLENQTKVRSDVTPPSHSPPVSPIEAAVSGIRLTGYVDTAYHWNFENPIHPVPSTTGAVDRNQSMGVFDTEANSFTLHAVKLAFEKSAPQTGGAGFRTDLLIGDDAKVVSSAGTDTNEFDFEQAYVEARLPLRALEGDKILGDKIYLKAGKFVTLAGAEVIEAKDDWNTTRSLLFGFAEPATHTGIRAAYDLYGGKVTLTTGLNNGWDTLEDNNNYKTWEGQMALKPNDDWLFTIATYMGPENANQAGHTRFLYDFVALWKVTQKFSLMANVDIGNEKRVVQADGNFENALWHGYALYCKYQATEKWDFATRGELFMDRDNFRVGAAALSPVLDYVGGTTVTSFHAREAHYWEWTSTTEYKLYDNVISRLEYRYDWSDAPIFSGESSQNTLSAQLIYNFA